MAFKVSTGTRNHILATEDVASAINGNVIKIYGDPVSAAAADALVPASANDSVSGATLLCTISVDGGGTGINMETVPVDGILSKATAEAWYGTNVASGYASFYRLSAAADTGALSTTEKRMQGTVDILNCDLIVASKYLTIAEEQRVDTYYVGMPEGA